MTNPQCWIGLHNQQFFTQIEHTIHILFSYILLLTSSEHYPFKITLVPNCYECVRGLARGWGYGPRYGWPETEGSWSYPNPLSHPRARTPTHARTHLQHYLLNKCLCFLAVSFRKICVPRSWWYTSSQQQRSQQSSPQNEHLMTGFISFVHVCYQFTTVFHSDYHELHGS